MKFRKRPVVIEAMQYRSVMDLAPAMDFLGDAFDGFEEESSTHKTRLLIETKEGVMRANEGDWLIKGVAGEFYPCKPEIFAATYDMEEAPKSSVGFCMHGRPFGDDCVGCSLITTGKAPEKKCQNESWECAKIQREQDDKLKKFTKAAEDARDMISHAIALDYLGEGSTRGWANETLTKLKKLVGPGHNE